jgi:hypothetical protein
MRAVIIFLISVVIGCVAHAEVVRPAPNFSWPGIPKRSSAKAVRGQPIVLLIADSPRSGAFKKQVKRIREVYQFFAARKVVFAAAFRKEQGPVRSDVPFVVVNEGAALAGELGIDRGFGLVVIGVDGNIDLQTAKVSPASRIQDVLRNAAPAQAAQR